MNEQTKKNSQSLQMSKDAFFEGRFFAYQPKSDYHKATTETLLLAACLPEGEGRVAELGAGSGVASFALNIRVPTYEIMLVDKDTSILQCAQQSINENPHFKKQMKIINLDVLSDEKTREAKGLERESFEHVMMNPPFYDPLKGRVSPHKVKAQAHHIREQDLLGWFKTATSALKPAGTLSVILPASHLYLALDCMKRRFGDIKVLPIHKDPLSAAHRIILQGLKGTKGDCLLCPALFLHLGDGSFTPKAEDIIREGRALSFLPVVKSKKILTSRKR